jgi:alpha-ketoglutarate-dependent 2,4-dichlorophenoxyacetate dioxygenase
VGIAIRQLHPLFGAEISGVDLRHDLDLDSFAQIDAAFDRYAVLVFPAQALDDEQQIAFSRHFGPLEVSMGAIRKDRRQRLRPELADVSNLDENHAILSPGDWRQMFNLGNQLWHTDSSFKRVPAKCSLLHGRAVPPTGGETEFADLRAAWEALPETTQRRIDGLVAEHSIFHSRAAIGYTAFAPEEYEALPAVPQVVTRVHPGSGRKTLYLASHASHILGWPVEEGRALLRELIEFATQPRFTYAHRWRENDLVLWDDRCTLHRGRPFEETRYRRDMRRTTVEDIGPTVEQAAARATAGVA